MLLAILSCVSLLHLSTLGFGSSLKLNLKRPEEQKIREIENYDFPTEFARKFLPGFKENEKKSRKSYKDEDLHIYDSGPQKADPAPQELKHMSCRNGENDIDEIRRGAIFNIIANLVNAVGPKVIKESLDRMEQNISYPTISSPENFSTLYPCSETYKECSIQTYFTSCEAPTSSDLDLLGQRLNLYFDVPSYEFKSGNGLLNATLSFYKNGTLPLRPNQLLIFELYANTKGLLDDDIDILYDSRMVRNHYIGWITSDLTRFLKRMNLTDNHGLKFMVKIKEFGGVYWNDPQLIVPMDCNLTRRKKSLLECSIKRSKLS